MRFQFAGLTLDCAQFELRRAGERLEAQPKVWAFLRLLAENPQRVLTKDEIFAALWPEVVVSEASLQRLASVARQHLGDAASVLRTVRGVGYELDTPVTVVRAPDAAERPEPGAPAVDASAPARQKIHFATTSDGYHVAWSQVGDGPPLVRALGWFTNLEMEWLWSPGRRLWESLARRHRLIRYDGRGMGLSDPAGEFSWETGLRDLEAVVDAAGLERFALLGMSCGAHTALRYAARNPERVSHLVLYGVPNAGPLSDEHKSFGHTVRAMVGQAWGREDGPFGRFLAELFLGRGASPEMLDYFDRMQRASADRDTAKRYAKSIYDLDAVQLAPRIATPSLVIHRQGDHICPFGEGRKLAAAIPGASFLPLAGENHWLLLDDPGAGAFVESLGEFLAQ